MKVIALLFSFSLLFVVSCTEDSKPTEPTIEVVTPLESDALKPAEPKNDVATPLEFTPNHWGSSAYTWAADFNGDGKTDIASASAGNVYMYLSTGVDFELSVWTLPGVWGDATYTWVADFNGDGKADIASASAGNVYMHLSTGTGFTNQTWTTPGVWGNAAYTWVADFNNDGKADIASASADNVYMHLSTGTGFTNQTWTTPGVWGSSSYTWAADFDGDGNADIASASAGNVYMHLSTGSAFNNQTWTTPGVWGSYVYTWVADFNADGASGIASASAGNVYMHLSTGTGLNNQTWTVPNQWGESGYTWTGDFDGNGYTDIASASGNAVYMSLSRGGRFASQVWYSSTGSTSGVAQEPMLKKAESLEMVLDTGKPLYKCADKFGVGQWAINFDTRRSLSYSMTLAQLGYTKKLYGPSNISSADDGLYIFVLHRTPKPKGSGGTATLRIRRSDRPDDVGFSVQGDKTYSYSGNIACPNTNPSCVLQRGEKAESPHQFVRHTQLNQGTDIVYSAGQLQIRGGKIIWINNASGHFAPSLGSLDCVEEYIDVLSIPRAYYQFKRNREWNTWVEPHDEL